MKSVVEQVGPDVLKNFGLFDVYRGGIDSGEKFSIGLTFRLIPHSTTMKLKWLSRYLMVLGPMWAPF